MLDFKKFINAFNSHKASIKHLENRIHKSQNEINRLRKQKIQHAQPIRRDINTAIRILMEREIRLINQYNKNIQNKKQDMKSLKEQYMNTVRFARNNPQLFRLTGKKPISRP
jgi:uncharacterized protein YdcH (DUF465 family)